jgi:hypothetical protein
MSPVFEKPQKLERFQVDTPLNEIKKRLEDESVKNTIKIMKHAYNLEEMRQKNRALIEKNKQKLMKNLLVLSKETE